jgi:asparagine synthase (glutamine-hydrolysing)
MCGIGGFYGRQQLAPKLAEQRLRSINQIQHHRGPDGEGVWWNSNCAVGFAHTRLSIIDLASGAQPMISDSGNVVVNNGEIYNYLELQEELGRESFKTTSDTEVILKAYEKWGPNCVEKLRGMFAFALWDDKAQKLFIARDRFGIKPFYYTVQDGTFYFASEIKALLPFRKNVDVSREGICDYFTFQFCLNHKTLFDDVWELQPAHCGYVGESSHPDLRQYWEVEYDLDWDHTEKYFIEQLRERLLDSVNVHLRSDVEVGAYVSGGIDSSLVAALARRSRPTGSFQAFTGKFSENPKFDESAYARALTGQNDILLHETDITESDFVEYLPKVLYHLDYPVAGPGAFPQYMVSKEVRKHLKVVLGGQGGDEIFGGYTRYLIAYFEQCIKGAIDGTMSSGNYIVSYESIIPNLSSLRNYKPLLQEFWAEGIFSERDERYFRLINRRNTMEGSVSAEVFNGSSSFADFQKIYWGKNVGKGSYFDSMTHFDFKTLLPALLQVEDRMSMAHGIESRVPLLDHQLVELVAQIPSNIKFQNGELKRLLKTAFSQEIPESIRERKDKMGFPVPLTVWTAQKGLTYEFIMDQLGSRRARERFYIAPGFDIEKLMKNENLFGRNVWALLSLELWQQTFVDAQRRSVSCEYSSPAGPGLLGHI